MPAAIGVHVDGVVKVNTPGINVARGTATLAQVNAGFNIPGLPSSGTIKYRVVGFHLDVNGAWATGTTINLSDRAATPVDVATFAQAQLTDGAFLRPGDTGVTLAAAFVTADLTGGQGLQFRTVGSDFDTGTDINYMILYEIIDGAGPA